jgi:hypothetical protein
MLFTHFASFIAYPGLSISCPRQFSYRIYYNKLNYSKKRFDQILCLNIWFYTKYFSMPENVFSLLLPDSRGVSMNIRKIILVLFLIGAQDSL